MLSISGVRGPKVGYTVIEARMCIKGTSNYLAEFEKEIETASRIFLNFLHDLRGKAPNFS